MKYISEDNKGILLVECDECGSTVEIRRGDIFDENSEYFRLDNVTKCTSCGHAFAIIDKPEDYVAPSYVSNNVQKAATYKASQNKSYNVSKKNKNSTYVPPKKAEPKKPVITVTTEPLPPMKIGLAWKILYGVFILAMVVCVALTMTGVI